jgi:hypothetical protein
MSPVKAALQIGGGRRDHENEWNECFRVYENHDQREKAQED